MHRPGVLAAALLGGLVVLSGLLHPDAIAVRAANGSSAVPEAPAPGYTPRFVTQTDEAPPWNDCLWASASMLLDKWTHGRIQVDRRRLRRASGDFKGGSTFADLARATARLYGWRAQFSPAGGDPLTWNGLLDRLEGGGGAIVAGDYGDLGNPFIRWDRSYAASRSAAGHAMYVERYDRAHDRMWLMDPLGRGDYRGEWIPARRIRAFIWKRNGFVHAVATPAPPARSATGWLPDQLTLDAEPHRAAESVGVSLTFRQEGPWPLPNLVLSATWEEVAPDAGPALIGRQTGRTPLFLQAGQAASPAPLVASGQLALPIEPGLWRLTPVIERGDGRQLPDSWRQAPLDYRVWGDRGAVVLPQPPTQAGIAAGQPVLLTVVVENAGREPWSSVAVGPDVGEDVLGSAGQLEVSWSGADGEVVPAAVPLTLTAASGQAQAIALSLLAPRLPGTYEVRFDVRDAQGSLLAPEAAGTSLVVVVGPAPVSTVAPIQNQ